VQNEYNTAVNRQNQLQAAFYAQEQANHGILIRLEALSQLSSGNFTVTAARFLLFLLFLVIECLPVTVKLLQRPGLYEEALLHARAAEREDVQKFYNDWSGLRPRWAQVGSGPAVVPEQDRQNSREDVRSIWTPTSVIPSPVGHPDAERVTEVMDYGHQGHSQRTAEYPPGETDPRPAYGWGRSAEDVQQSADDGEQSAYGRTDRPYADEQRLDETARDPWVGQTRPDTPHYRDAMHGDAYQPQHGPAEENGYQSEVGSAHDELADMDDEPAAARLDGKGIALTWDDDE
jgi:hypothetical protein